MSKYHVLSQSGLEFFNNLAEEINKDPPDIDRIKTLVFLIDKEIDFKFLGIKSSQEEGK